MSAEPTASASARPAWWAKTALRADREVSWDRVWRAQANLRKRVEKMGRAATKSRRSVETSNYQRWYRPSDGRYLSPDPIGLAGGEAGYFGYAGSNPGRLSDPHGLLRPAPVTRRDGKDTGGGGGVAATHTTFAQTTIIPNIIGSVFPYVPLSEPLSYDAAKAILGLLEALSDGTLSCTEFNTEVGVSGPVTQSLCIQLIDQGLETQAVETELEKMCEEAAEALHLTVPNRGIPFGRILFNPPRIVPGCVLESGPANQHVFRLRCDIQTIRCE